MIRWFTKNNGARTLQYWHTGSFNEEWRDVPEITEAGYELEQKTANEAREKETKEAMERLKGKTYTVR